MSKLLISSLVALIFSNSAMAGATQLTHNSRANCGNNESISWDGSRKRTLSVSSYHVKSGTSHYVTTGGFSSTYRAAAVHWGESFTPNLWYVRGTHWEMLNGRTIRTSTYASDCRISEGWY